MRITAREKIVDHVVLSIFAIFAVTPLVGVLLSSLTPSVENSGAFAVPSRIALGNYVEAWVDGRFGTYMFSSIVVTVSVVALTTLLAILASFAFARLTFRGSQVLFFVMLAGLMFPAEAFVIPLYFNLRSVSLLDTYASLILPQTAQSLAFAIFWLRNQFRSFPNEIVEAARLDGARDLQLLWRVIVPPSLPAIATMCLLVAMWTWNEFLIPLVMIVSENRRTAPLGLAFFKGAHLTDYSLLSAAGVIVASPIVILYFILQRRFITGMLGGIADR
jgi:raffinose/stachyose/melibiose transport system permease protein